MTERLGPEGVLPVVGGGALRPGPYSEHDEEWGWVHYGPGWPEDPFDWRFGCSFAPLEG